MADAKLYLRPLGFLYGDAADAALASGVAPAFGRRSDRLHRGRADRGHRREQASGNSSRPRPSPPRTIAMSRRCSSASPRPVRPSPDFALDRPLIMGIVNVTPNSFSDGGLYDKTEGAVMRAAELATVGRRHRRCRRRVRPARAPTPVQEGDELARVVPVLEGLAGLQRRDLHRYAESRRGPRRGRGRRQDLQRRLGADP